MIISKNVILAAAASVAVLLAEGHYAKPAQPEKLELLSDAEEAHWIEFTKNFVTADGSTVLEVLQYAHRARPHRFSFGKFEAEYAGGTGNPSGIGVESWVGEWRTERNKYNIGFDIDRRGNMLFMKLVSPDSDNETSIGQAVVQGKVRLLRWIDQTYQGLCYDENNSRIC